jgi:hypothetical protein
MVVGVGMVVAAAAEDTANELDRTQDRVGWMAAHSFFVSFL